MTAKRALDTASEVDYNLIDDDDHEEALEYKLYYLDVAKLNIRSAAGGLVDFLTLNDLNLYGIAKSKKTEVNYKRPY